LLLTADTLLKEESSHMASYEAEAFTIQSAHKTILENVDTLRTQRAGLVTDISRMHDEVITLSKRLESIRMQGENELQKISSEKDLAQKNIDDLRQESSRLRNHIDALDPVKRHLEVSIHDRQIQLERVENRLSEARSVAEEYATQIDQAKTLWHEVVRRTQDETKHLELLRTETSSLEPHRKEAGELSASIKRLKLENSILVATVDELRKAEQELRAKLSSINIEYENQKQRELSTLKALHEADLVLARTRLEHEMLVERGDDIRRTNETFSEKNIELETRKALLEKDIIEAQARHHQLEASLDPLREMAQQREAELRRVDTEIADSRSTLKDLSLQVTEREKRIDSLSERHDELLVENRRMETIIDSLHQQETSYRAKISDAQTLSQKTESDLNQARFTLGELNNEIIRNRAINERFATENTALQEAVTQTQSELARLTAEKTKVISETDRSLEKRAETERQLQIQSQKTQELTAQSERLQQEIEERKQAVSALLNQHSEQKILGDSLHADIEHMRATLAALKHEKDAVNTSLESSRQTLEETKNALEGLRNKQAELTTVQSRVRDLLRREELVKSSLAQQLRTEKAIEERVAKLEHQENQVLSRIDSARNNLTQLEQNQNNLAATTGELQTKLDNIIKTTEEALRKRDGIMNILKRETDAIQQARMDLREIEDIKNAKLREIELLVQPPAAPMADAKEASPRKSESENAISESTQAPPLHSSEQVRADAEKTLESLRRHLEGILPKR
jgi:chromosome segregation ATPase